MIVEDDMIYQVSFLIFTAFITLSIAIYAFTRREETSALPFATLMIACSIHAFGYAFEIYSISTNMVKFWVSFEYIGIALFPFLIIWMTYAQKSVSSVRATIVLLLAFSTSMTTFFLIQTNQFHHLYYKSMTIERINEFSRVIFEKGPWYHIHSIITLIAFVVLLSHHYEIYKSSNHVYKTKARISLISIIFPIIAGVLYMFNVIPNNMDLMPFAYAPIGLLWLISMLKYGIFELIPVTYKRIFEHIEEGVVVLDKNNIIVNYNNAAYQIFKNITKLSKGSNFKGILDQLIFRENRDYEGKIFSISHKQKEKNYQIKNTNLNGKKENHMGKILVINDISEELEANRILKTLATKDSLTGINNRRHFFDLCHNIIQSAKHEGKRISFVLMDIDYFKSVNDSYGHLVGDKILRELTKLCYNSLRDRDIIGRYGGEEFGILLYDTSIQETHHVIERIRMLISNHPFYVDDEESIHLTVSFGVYRPDLTKETDLNVIFKKADIGLYKAKENGRDRVVFDRDYIV